MPYLQHKNYIKGKADGMSETDKQRRRREQTQNRYYIHRGKRTNTPEINYSPIRIRTGLNGQDREKKQNIRDDPSDDRNPVSEAAMKWHD